MDGKHDDAISCPSNSTKVSVEKMVQCGNERPFDFRREWHSNLVNE
jgi:hypothetical protein